MKLSIWQQFSSNHSSHFIVIGRFEDVEIATAKANQLRDWMYRMLWGNDEENATKELLAAYPVGWYEDGIDWNGTPESIDEVVRQFRTNIFLMCSVETWDDHQPFAELMRKMGPLNTVDGRSGGGYSAGMLVSITSVAPTPAIAQEIFAAVKNVLDQCGKSLFDRIEPPMPWAIYSPEFPNDSEQLAPSNYDQQEKQWLQDVMEWRKYHRGNFFDSDGKPLPNSQTKNTPMRRDDFSTQDKALRIHIYELRQAMTIYEGEARLEEATIFIEDLDCSRLDIFMIAFVQWLESFGCEVRYEFQSRDRQ